LVDFWLKAGKKVSPSSPDDHQKPISPFGTARRTHSARNRG
jgi:hypothetical protein